MFRITFEPMRDTVPHAAENYSATAEVRGEDVELDEWIAEAKIEIRGWHASIAVQVEFSNGDPVIDPMTVIRMIAEKLEVPDENVGPHLRETVAEVLSNLLAGDYDDGAHPVVAKAIADLQNAVR